MTTPWQAHIEKWKDCRLCRLCAGRKRVVLARGDLPCDVLFVGEAPWVSEDVTGLPFKGPAGALMNRIVEEAIPLEHADGPNAPPTGYAVTWAFTNLIGCIPRVRDPRRKDKEPLLDEVQACAPRLQDMIKIADPKLIVCVGGLAKLWLDQTSKKGIKLHKAIPMIDIVHPAHIITRVPPAGQGLAIRRAVVTISDAMENLGS